MIECARARANNKHSGHKACGPPVWSVTIGVWVTCRVRKLRTRVQREKPLVPMGVGNSTCTWTQHAVAHINDDEVTEGTCIRFLGNGLITESISWIAVLGSSRLKADVAYDKHCSYWCQHDSFTMSGVSVRLNRLFDDDWLKARVGQCATSSKERTPLLLRP